ncbi:MAG: FAD-dependent oxidoreductase, partial [Nitrospirota bacterium]|nr:FAD-dependent oxidoreductase [Nitrospirota bacterium]
TNVAKIENYPGVGDVNGADLIDQMTAQARRFGVEIISGDVLEVCNSELCRNVTLEDGTIITAKAMIVATGADPIKLKIPGEKEFMGRGVSYCATCDGSFFRDLTVAVVGGGDSAVEEAIFLTRFAKEVIVIHRRNKLRAQKIIQERAFATPRLRFIWDTTVEKVNGEHFVTSIDLVNLKTGEKSNLPADGIFIYVGNTPNTDFLRGVVALDESGYVITQNDVETSSPGIFAAGDVRRKLLRQISTAVGDGATAAVVAEKYIESQHA